MKNFRANGEVLKVVDDTNAVVGGQVYKVNSIIGIVVADAVAGEAFTVKITGAFDGLPLAASTALAVGEMVYWDGTAKKVTKTASGNTFMGYAYAPATSGDATCEVLLSH